MARLPLARLLAAALAALAAAGTFAPLASAASPDAPDAGADASTDAGTAIETVEGRITALDRTARTIDVAGPRGTVRLEFDRNTTVYLPERLGTVLDLAVGAPVRAAHGQDRRLFWVELERAKP